MFPHFLKIKEQEQFSYNTRTNHKAVILYKVHGKLHIGDGNSGGFDIVWVKLTPELLKHLTNICFIDSYHVGGY